jgi:C1A family cysteine protease
LIFNQLRAAGITDFVIETPVVIQRPGEKGISESFPYMLNYKPDPLDTRDYKVSAVTEQPLTYSLSVDYTSEMSLVKDQGRKGSCVGFAVVAMKEWQEQKEHIDEMLKGKKYKRKAKHYDLSEQWLYHKTKEIDDWPNQDGTSIRHALKILQKMGVPPEKAWPYSERTLGSPKRWAKMIALWTMCGIYYRLDGIPQIEWTLKNIGPCLVGFGCYEEIFYVGDDGYVPYPANPEVLYGGHAVCLVGYDSKKKLVKFKNSWGKNWGEKGYGYFSYDYVNNFVWDAWAVKDINVTKEMLKKT